MELDHEGLEGVNKLFRLAEQRCKVVEGRVDFAAEEDGNGLLIPTINQLRYAGHHLLKYVTQGKPYHLVDAKVHCERAIYDAYQVELLYYLRRFQVFQDDFSDVVISEVIPEYLKWQTKHEEVRTLLNEHFESDDRGEYYEMLGPYIQDLGVIHGGQFTHARELLLKKRQKEIRNDRLAIMGIVLALIAIALALAAWAFPEMLNDVIRHVL